MIELFDTVYFELKYICTNEYNNCGILIYERPEVFLCIKRNLFHGYFY